MAMRLRSDGVGDAATRRQHGTAVTSTARPQSDQRNAQAVAGHDVIDLIESKTRQPSLGEAADAAACLACGWRSTTVAAAPDAIRRLVMLARRALGRSECDTLEIEGRAADQALSFERVARLRDEIHVTANRVARFDIDEVPTLDPVRIAAPTAASATLAPAVLISQLDLSAVRLIAQVQARRHDWNRAGRIGDARVTVGELVNSVLHGGVHDLADHLTDASGPHAVPRGVPASVTSEERDVFAR